MLKFFSAIPSLGYSCWKATIITTLPIKVFYLGPGRVEFGDKVTCQDGVVVPQLLVVPLPLLTCQIMRRLWRLNPAVAPSGVNAEWMTMIPQEWEPDNVCQALFIRMRKFTATQHCLGKVLVLILSVRKDHISHFCRSSLTPSHHPCKLGMNLTY